MYNTDYRKSYSIKSRTFEAEIIIVYDHKNHSRRPDPKGKKIC